MSSPPTLAVRVRAITWEADGILGFELVPLLGALGAGASSEPGVVLPPFDAGSHIDIHLPGSPLVRSYSLLNAPSERHRYCIAVNRDAVSRGGSKTMHEAIRPGQVLNISAPRNNFPLKEGAAGTVLIAGGIGVTPILGMARRLVALNKPWRLHYAARTQAQAAFVQELKELAVRSGAQADITFDREPGGRMLDLPAIVAGLGAAEHVYCCGPLLMLEAFEKATAALPRERVHVEYFAAKEAAATAGGFVVKLAKAGREFTVNPGQSILDCLNAAGLDPPYSCREGICGTCEVVVLDGVPDHRDLVLSDAERAANNRIMICCSGAKTASLTLDL
jgi:tetrachlorobenzoquinone reductase